MSDEKHPARKLWDEEMERFNAAQVEQTIECDLCKQHVPDVPYGWLCDLVDGKPGVICRSCHFNRYVATADCSQGNEK